jgi:hypothetical protein
MWKVQSPTARCVSGINGDSATDTTGPWCAMLIAFRAPAAGKPSPKAISPSWEETIQFSCGPRLKTSKAMLDVPMLDVSAHFHTVRE